MINSKINDLPDKELKDFIEESKRIYPFNSTEYLFEFFHNCDKTLTRLETYNKHKFFFKILFYWDQI